MSRRITKKMQNNQNTYVYIFIYYLLYIVNNFLFIHRGIYICRVYTLYCITKTFLVSASYSAFPLQYQPIGFVLYYNKL